MSTRIILEAINNLSEKIDRNTDAIERNTKTIERNTTSINNLCKVIEGLASDIIEIQNALKIDVENDDKYS
jgi:methyl-accepting chemotaxis protein